MWQTCKNKHISIRFLHGDIVELYDEDGEYIRDYRYDAFGNQLLTNSGDTNPFRYAGEYYRKQALSTCLIVTTTPQQVDS